MKKITLILVLCVHCFWSIQLQSQTTLPPETITVDITGIQTFDEPGSLINTVLNVNLNGYAGTTPCSSPLLEVTGVGWDTNQTSFGASWLSEMTIGYDWNQNGMNELNVTPGAGDDFSGSMPYSSGGILDLTDNGIPDGLVANAVTGTMDLEFYESFVDVPGAAEGIFNAVSNLTIEYTLTCGGVVDGPPTAVCMDYTAQLDATGSVTITGANVDGGSSDAEGPVTLSVSPDTFTCADVGTPVTVTLTVTDSMGQMDTCMATVTVEDNVDPVFDNCPAGPITVNNDPGVCGAVVTYAAPTATDNCGSPMGIQVFTSAGASGRLGPDQAQCDLEYGTGVVTVSTQGYQEWIVPTTGVYNISAAGAQGSNNNNVAGEGAIMEGDFNLTAGDKLYILVGQQSVTNSTQDWQGGAGGTFVSTGVSIGTSSPLIVAGGGGTNRTTPTYSTTMRANTGTSGKDGSGTAGGTNGGAAAPGGMNANTGAGAAGYYGDGQSQTDRRNLCAGAPNPFPPALAFVNNGTGGYFSTAFSTPCVNFDGGFGGGGPGGWGGSGGGGGYSGGGTCSNDFYSGGGGSFVSVSAANVATSDGTFAITGSEPDTAYAGTVTDLGTWWTGGNGQVTISWTGIEIVQTDGTGFTSGDVFPVGTTVQEYTATDASGNMAVCSFTVTVNDTEDPVITCSNYTRDTDSNVCEYTVIGTEFEPTFSDNCTTATITNDYNNAASLDGAVFPQGDTVVTWTVDDGNGQMATCMSTITVNDTQAPIIGCPANLIASTDDDSCTAVVVFAQPSVIDNCSAAGDIIITQVTGIPSGGTFPQGVNQVGFSATDEAGNVSFCSFTITVEDNTDPVAVCMDATVTLDAFGNATITPAAVNGGSTDNCGISSSSVDITSFTCADIGPNTVILTVTDINGNTDTCEAIVMVVDTTAPVAVCQDITVELGPDGTVTIDGSLMDDGSSDSCGAGTLTFTTDPAVLSCSDIGQRFVDLIVTDESGNSSTCTAIVTVEDNLDPVLVCQDTTIELGPDGTATVDPMALLDMTNPLDNCGIDVLSVDVTEVNCNDVGGTIAITVFASDNAGNFSSCVATVTVVDTSGPVFDQASLPQGPLTRLIDPATGFYRLEDFRVGVSSTDNCSEGLLPISVSQTPFAGTPLTEGTYDITITAMDEAGNETDHVFVLMVEPALGVGDNELTLSTLTMYPNPASDKVILSNPQNIQLRDLQVYDLTGRLVQKVDLSETLSETVIDVSTLQSATYMFVISTEKASITKQIIKE